MRKKLKIISQNNTNFLKVFLRVYKSVHTIKWALKVKNKTSHLRKTIRRCRANKKSKILENYLFLEFVFLGSLFKLMN
jgi:hypothetical protein